MKITNVAAIAAATALAAAVFAQGRPPQGGPPGGMGRGPGMGMGRARMTPQEQADRMTQGMTQMLGLSPAQQTKIKAIILKSATEMKKLRDAQDAAIKKVLTPDQQKKMASMPPRGMGGMGRGGMGGGMGRGPGRP